MLKLLIFANCIQMYYQGVVLYCGLNNVLFANSNIVICDYVICDM